MYCKICGDRNNNFGIFGTNLCRRCLSKLETISIDDKDYDNYKNLIRILLSYYIEDKELNPVN